MNVRLTTSGCLLVVLVSSAAVSSAQGARIQLDHLNRLAEKADRDRRRQVDSTMLKQSAGFLAGRGGDIDQLRTHSKALGEFMSRASSSSARSLLRFRCRGRSQAGCAEAWARIVSVAKNSSSPKSTCRKRETMAASS